MDSYGNVARIVQQEKHNIGFSRKERMAFLLRWSEVKVYHKRSYSRRRNGSSADSWKRILRDLCWVCRSADATARHHIIQVQHGGGNDGRNIIPICDGCHAEVHHWMDASDHPIVKEAKAMDSCPFNRLPL
jgi:5-methylcytosine-specific restriction endonuclease McrA